MTNRCSYLAEGHTVLKFINLPGIINTQIVREKQLSGRIRRQSCKSPWRYRPSWRLKEDYLKEMKFDCHELNIGARFADSSEISSPLSGLTFSADGLSWRPDVLPPITSNIYFTECSWTQQSERIWMEVHLFENQKPCWEGADLGEDNRNGALVFTSHLYRISSDRV